MKNPILRLALVVLAVAGQAAAGFFVFQQEQAQADARSAQAVLTREAGRVHSMIGELRGAQAGMVAPDQDAGFWVPKVGALVQDAATSLKNIDRKPLGPESAQDLAAATEALAAFSRTSDRVRDALANGQPLTASSLAFGEAAQHLSTASGALASVGPSQALAVDRESARRRLLEAYALLGAGGVTVLALLLLLPRVRQPEPQTIESQPLAGGLGLSLAAAASTDADPLGKSGFDLDIPRPPATAAGDALPEPPRKSEVDIVDDLQRESQLTLNTEAPVDLAETARLCGDLARVRDGTELPALLARAAEILDASGIVVWIAEPRGSVLRPAASYGYNEHTLAKMNALAVDAENAVSVTFRTCRSEVVRGTRERHGAVVTPINASGGCVGAMAAEIRHGAEASPAVQAVAAIISAQLASLVAETTTPA